MKKELVLIFLLSLYLSAVPPVSAQRLKGPRFFSFKEKVFVRYNDAEAFSDGGGVWLKWNTASESGNLGFNVYRLTGGGRELVNPSLIPGLYLQTRDALPSGGSYSFFDAKGDFNSIYVIESLNLNGQKRTTGAIFPKYVEDLTAVAGVSSPFLKGEAEKANPVVLHNENNLPSDLKSEFENNGLQADITAQRLIAAQPGVKIGVKNEGVYRVSRGELEASGFDVKSPSEFWQLYKNGVEQAINVGGNGDYIEFYGRGIDTRDTDTQIYFLIAGSQNGKRIAATFRRTLGSRILTDSYNQTIVYKERTIYSQGVQNGEEENFFGRLVNNTPTTIALNLPAVNPNAANYSIDLTVQGLTFVQHQIKVVLNNVELGFINGKDADSMTKHFDIPASVLVSGVNNLQLSSIAGTTDYSFFDKIKVNYSKEFKAQQNQLSFYVPNYRASYLENFTSPNIRVFDVSDPDAPTLISRLKVEQNNGGYRAYIPSNRGRVMFAVEDSAIMSAAFVQPNNPSTLSNTANAADMIVISYKDWMKEAEDWANYRRKEGMSVEVVNVEDVYDEFSFGAISSYAIKDFLQYAYINRQTQPKYILLIGDATYDPRDYLGKGANNFVPTKMVETIYLETGSDEALADFNDDGLAEIAVGRIPARNAQFITLALNKVAAFERLLGTQGLSRGAIFASDLPDGYDFAALNDRLRSQLPSGVSSVTINRGQSNARATLLSELNGGKFIVNYSGHGNNNVWASPSFFGQADAAALTNSNTSIFTMLTCLNGYFFHPTDDALAETLLKRENGGAVASWASSSLTTPDVQERMAARFYSQIGASNSMRLGDLIKDAKTTIPGGRDVRLSWVLLGDPALKVK